MDVNSQIYIADKDIALIQQISIEEHTRDHQGKTKFYENIEKMQEQIAAIKTILDMIESEKYDLDYGLKPNIDIIKINTLKYITDHLLQRVHIAELLMDDTHQT